MIIVLHGDNQVASRERFVQLQANFEEKGWNIITLDGKTVEWEQIQISATSGSLLGEGNAVLVEGFWSGKRKTQERGLEITGNVVFWEPKGLPKTLTGSFPKDWKVEHFEIPRLVFRFLDTLSPKTSKNALTLLHQILEHEAAELMLPLIAWHVRQLIWIKEEPETTTIPYWKKNKLAGQASQFTKEQLYEFHSHILALDRSIKTGTSPLPLSSSLDLMIANL